MSEQRIASRYARPLLELANEQGCLEEVMADMVNFKSLCDTNRDFVLMLKNPIIPHLKKLSVLKEIFSKKVNALTLSVFELISRKHRESYLPEVANEFTRRYNTFKGISEATVTTVIPLSAALTKDVETIVKSITGKDAVVLTQLVDKDIIGGFILKIDDRQIDDSISGKLNELKLKFNQKL